MNIVFIYIWIFIAILLIAIAVKVLKSVIKIVFFVSFVFFIFLFVAGYFVVNDANDFKDNFPSGQKTFLITKDEMVEAGFVLQGSQLTAVEYLDKEELDNLTEQINSGDLDIGDNYKIFIADYEMFDESLEQGVNYEDFTVDKELADEIFSSDDPLTVLAKDIDENNWRTVRNQLASDIGTNAEVKGAIFAILMTNGLTSGPTYIIENLKSENLEIYPDSPLFMAIKVIPESVYENVIGEQTDELEVLGEE